MGCKHHLFVRKNTNKNKKKQNIFNGRKKIELLAMNVGIVCLQNV